MRFRSLLALAIAVPGFAATFGTVVSIVGGASDIVLDEPRGRIYLTNSSSNELDIYQTGFNPPRVTNPIRGICRQPVAAAMSRPDGKSLYITCFDDSSLVILDLDSNPLRITRSVTLPAKPEGVAVGGDGRVLITTIGTGQGRQTLITYDPVSGTLSDVFVTPPAPASPQLPAPSGRIFLAYRSHLEATRDGRYIVGVNGSGNTRIVFVYEVNSATVLRSRLVTNLSGVLSVAPDGSKFMAGSTLFDLETLQVLAQQNGANAPFPFPNGNSGNFNLQQNQGGSVFSPSGAVLYTAFNMAPVQNPPARANISRLLLNDPDNLLITMGLQLAENLAGKMVISADGRRIYALSESGFTVLPVSDINQSPLAQPESRVVMLANDQCGVTVGQNLSTIKIANAGNGRMTVSAQLLQQTGNVAGLGGIGGPGGGGPGGAIIIVIPPTLPGGAAGPGIGGFGAPGQQGGGNQQNGTTQTSPFIRMGRAPDGSQTIDFLFNATAARSLGTVPPHDFLIQSPEAINIPPDIRVFQNNRDADAKGAVLPVEIGVSNSEGLVDMLTDNTRQRLYIANSGMNRVEVFDMRAQKFLAPIKVGQLPRSLAFGNDTSTLYVTSSGAESISIVDLDQGKMVGRVKFPPLPFNAGFSLITPSVLASSLRGPQIIMSDGTLWKVVGDTAVPRALNPGVFGANVRVVPAANPAVRTMASTPDGQYVMLMTSSGFVYLYSAAADDFVVGRQIFSTPINGFIGPVAAGPGGQYYLANGTVLNDSLTPIAAAPTFTIGSTTPTPGIGTTPGGGTAPGGGRPGTPVTTDPTPVDPTQPPLPGQVPGVGGALPIRGTVTVSRPVAAVTAVSKSTFMRFTQAVRLNATAAPTDAGAVELVDVNTGNTMATSIALEGPLSVVQGNGRSPINGRMMAVDAAGTTAYVLTTSGLTVVPVSRPNPTTPRVLPGGIVNNASYQSTLAPGSLVSIFGQNLASGDAPSSATEQLPYILGGSCVTLNNVALPLLMSAPNQINAQIPPTLAAGRYPLVIRSAEKQAPSQTSLVTISKYAPAVFVSGGQPAIFHPDGSPVTKDHKAHRDERLTILATGLGATKGGRVTAGAPAPSNPLAVTDKVQVFFGNPGYKQAEMIVEWSGLVPGLVGVNRINIYVPGEHMKGDALPVTLRIGGVNSPTAGVAVPTVAVE